MRKFWVSIILPLVLQFSNDLNGFRVYASPTIGSWTPLYKGVDHAIGTNLPSTTMPHRLVANVIRADLTDPDVKLFTTPRIEDYVQGVREIAAYTVSDFLVTNKLQVAINANLFDAREYYLPVGMPMNMFGLAVCNGEIVSIQDSPEDATAIVFDRENKPLFVANNWPSIALDDVHTAVTGTYPLVIEGRNVAYAYEGQRGFIHAANPRTVFGISKDGRYLYLMTIDGRQPGYSEGALDYEAADWLLLVGAYSGMNMDGGGSTTLVMESSTGAPVRLNRSSAVADSGKERTVGSHLGIYAKPLKEFIFNVTADPDESTASISWDTDAPATALVEYGSSPELGAATSPLESFSTQHRVLLSGLRPNTGYYYRAVSSTADATYRAPIRFFTTIHHAVTNRLFSLEQNWKYSATAGANLNWTARDFSESNWDGTGPGLLWVDTRATGPNPLVQPRGTQMGVDLSNSGFPYRAYYFRTHFQAPQNTAGTSLIVSGYIDDGAIFYLNGIEVYRLRMPDGSVDPFTLASSFPCNGDSTCEDRFEIPVEALSSMRSGDNVLSVEVHNYNARSADITFGIALDIVEPILSRPSLIVERTSSNLRLLWAGSGYALQFSDQPIGPWKDVAEATSPWTISLQGQGRYFRLRR